MEKPTIYAFIDSQNLHMGVENDIVDRKTKKTIYKGWKLDYKKFRLYLTNKFGVDKAYLFIGQVPGNEAMYNRLIEQGYTLVFKPTIPYDNGGKMDTKGNVDAELVLYASALTFNKYDKAVIVSGDGDFQCLVEYLDAEGKLLKILAPSIKFSSLLRKYAHYILTVGSLKNTLEYQAPVKSQSFRIMPHKTQKTGIGGRSKP